MDYQSLIQRLVDDDDSWSLYPNPIDSAALSLWRDIADSMCGGDDCYHDCYDSFFTRDEFEFLFQQLLKRYGDD